ncbi:MAG TPA: M6 family metalloprotease domain-containing protein [Paludibacteraceae bacterium]|nr:M6 family metalloprotease domain-containing protein [Paludibacteraceae bacterium]
MKNYLILLLFVVFAGGVYGAPAYPKPMVVTLPDGSNLTICQHGDEAYHYTTTDDGYLIDGGTDGFYYFVEKAEQKSLKLSAVKACDAKKRSQEVTAFLKNIDKNLRPSKENIERKIVTKPAFQVAPKTGTQKSFVNHGRRKALVILGQFTDCEFMSPETVQQVYNDRQNQVGYNGDGHIGSVHDYFYHSSRGKLDLEFVVVGPYTASQNVAYYGANTESGADIRPREFITELCLAAVADGVDFTPFDTDNDGYVDNVYVIYAGKGEAAGGAPHTIWPHAWRLRTPLFVGNNKYVYTYGCNAELNWSGTMDGIGTFVHEFGHVIGLPDLYDTNYAENGLAWHPSIWSVMAQGNYNNNSRTPPQLSSLERAEIGWEYPVILDTSTTVTLSPLDGQSNGDVVQSYRINTLMEDEYYLLENRKLSGWDAYLAEPGLLIYHIDKSLYAITKWRINRINADSAHQCAEIVKAYPTENLTKNSVYTPFPGQGNVTTFTDDTNPSMFSWYGDRIDKPITDIALKNDTITFKFMGGFSATLHCTANLDTFAAKLNQPSAVQSVTVSGAYLTDNVIVTVGGNQFEIKKTDGSEWTDSVVFVPVSGTLEPTSVEIRYKPTLEGEQHTDSLKITSTGATDLSVAMVGTVVVGELSATRQLQNQTLDFGSGVLNVQKRKTLEISAVGLTSNVDITISGAQAESFSSSVDVITKEAAEEGFGAQVSVIFQPKTVGNHEAVLTLSENSVTLAEVILTGYCD